MVPNDHELAVTQTDWRRFTACVAMGAVGAFLALVALLHAIEPEFDPGSRMLSEYAIGRYGWVMTLAFLSLGSGSAALVAVLWSSIRTLGGRIGLGLLAVFSASVALAALFPTDSVPEQLKGISTPTGLAHNLCAIGAINGLPLAATLIALRLRHDERWRSERWRLVLLTLLVWLGYGALIGWLVAEIVPRGWDGPGSGIGWPNRLMMVCYCIWLLMVAHRAARLASPVREEEVQEVAAHKTRGVDAV
jgi:hypothetical protein